MKQLFMTSVLMVACIVQVGCSDSIIPDQSEHNHQDKISVLINEAYSFNFLCAKLSLIVGLKTTLI